MNRRTLIKTLLSGFGISLFGCEIGGDNDNSSKNSDCIFPQSIASGDPSPSGIVLWTRINPDYIQDKKVKYQIAEDKDFNNIVVEGYEDINTDGNHTVKVFIDNQLNSWRTYYYRFIYQNTTSKVGKFKTLPEENQNIQEIKFVYLSCQDYANGYYTSYPHVVNEDIDFIVWLGDYIYEEYEDPDSIVREINLPSGYSMVHTLEDYYYLYNTYKSDKNLQLLHENFAFIPVWDDHEFANDCYGYHAPDHDFKNDDDKLKKLRLEATKAWYENLPVNVPYNKDAQDIYNIQTYRSFKYGNLIELILTDERLYRSPHPCGEGDYGERFLAKGCRNEKSEDRTMLGETQKNWFLNKVQQSGAKWIFWGNPVIFMKFKINEYYIDFDAWDGFQYERNEIIQNIKNLKENGQVENFIILTGDLHSFVAGNISEDFETDFIFPEFVSGAVSSSNLAEVLKKDYGFQDLDLLEGLIKHSNDHIKYINLTEHGYSVVHVKKDEVKIVFKMVSTIKKKTACIEKEKIFTIKDGETLS